MHEHLQPRQKISNLFLNQISQFKDKIILRNRYSLITITIIHIMPDSHKCKQRLLRLTSCIKILISLFSLKCKVYSLTCNMKSLQVLAHRLILTTKSTRMLKSTLYPNTTWMSYNNLSIKT